MLNTPSETTRIFSSEAVEMIQIVMPEAHHPRYRPQRSFHQAGVQVVIANHHVALFG